jgi:NAD(P)-dependent dehydrogenase (short-subunit alcohol dehydrogenase family)
MADLTDKWALVTGASRGIGKLVAHGLAGLGCNLVLHSRDLANTENLVEVIRTYGVEAEAVAGELSDPAQVDAMLDAALDTAGEIDIVYNNAAIQLPWCADPWNVPLEDYRKSFEVNVIALVRICYRLVPPMLERQWGRVINVTSGIVDLPNLAPYAASKAAVDKFVRDFAPHLKDSGVQMNLLDPGWLRTDLGGPEAPNDPSTVLPGALVPALLDDGVSGRWFSAQDYAGLSLEEAIEKALAK